MGAGAVVTGSDDDTTRSGAVERRRGGRGAGGPGPRRARPRLRAAAPRAPPRRGELEPGAELPQVRRYDLRRRPRARERGARRHRRRSWTAAPRAWPAWPPSARCPSDEPILYAGDLSAARAAAPGRARRRRGGERLEPAAALRARVRPPEPRRHAAGRRRAVDANFALIEPFPERGSDAQTVAALDGARYLRAPSEGGLLEFPEHARDRGLRRRPLDGLGGGPLPAAERRAGSRSASSARATCPTSTCTPRGTGAGSRREVEVNGVRATLGPGRNRVRLDARGRGQAARDDHRRRPAAGRPARQRRLPRDPDPGRAGAPARCARRCSPGARWPAAT